MVRKDLDLSVICLIQYIVSVIYALILITRYTVIYPRYLSLFYFLIKDDDIPTNYMLVLLSKESKVLLGFYIG